MNILLIPYKENESILLPKALVKYVLPYAPMLPSGFNSDIVIGSLIYDNEKVPVVDFSEKSDVSSGINVVAKLIIVACISENSPVSKYAVISRYAPTMLSLSESDIEETYEPVPELFNSLVRIKHDNEEQLVFVPNMEKTESEIFSLEEK